MNPFTTFIYDPGPILPYGRGFQQTGWARRTLLLLAPLIAGLLLSSPRLWATPLLALKEAQNCQGCHNPGRSQRPVLDRRCTLDCQGCHIDPSGAGARNQWGYYYSQDQLALFNFYKPIDPLKDTSRFDLHYDGRVIQRQTPEGQRTFPMSSELTLRLRPFIEYLHVTYAGLYMGRIGDRSFRAARDDDRRYLEKYSVMIDNLPMALYVKAGRGQPVYGLRRPNHSLWIRERIGLDQFALTDGIDFGGTPNVPFIRGSVMQGDPRSPPEDRQVGTTVHGGLRGVTLGWHLNGSAWDSRSKKNQVHMRALGGGLRPWKFILMGERNFRTVTTLTPSGDTSGWQSLASRIHPSSQIDEWTVAFDGIPGVILGSVYESLDESPLEPQADPQDGAVPPVRAMGRTRSKRRSLFVDLHPVPNLQVEIWQRQETGSRDLRDVLVVAHLYGDF